METNWISQDPASKVAIVQLGVPQGYAQATVSTTAVALPSIPASCDRALIIMEAQGDCRWRDDGINPTSTVGMYMFAGQSLVIESQKSINNFRIIRQGNADVTLNVSYYSRS